MVNLIKIIFLPVLEKEVYLGLLKKKAKNL
jgi:hypothetical protein